MRIVIVYIAHFRYLTSMCVADVLVLEQRDSLVYVRHIFKFIRIDYSFLSTYTGRYVDREKYPAKQQQHPHCLQHIEIQTSTQIIFLRLVLFSAYSG